MQTNTNVYEATYTDGDCQSFSAADWADANEQALGHEDPQSERTLFALVNLEELAMHEWAESTIRRP